ncbi:AbiJ-NTD4 domain-containing protein [Salinicola aestuarinus]|uniref:AbiJ-NTD4 domain-containing protein n=1 Tax=Salinicola aestuarinus TaxID=1949082 RepID=UPI001300B918|nr:hypothetical protein [Salinicola aestuarinus]
MRGPRFSSRFVSNSSHSSIIKDAPRATRVGFVKGVLAEYLKPQSSMFGVKSEGFDIYDVHLKFIALIRDESEPWEYDDRDAWDGLKYHLLECEWLEFYDFVEFFGHLMAEREKTNPFGAFGAFEAYRGSVNSLLIEDNIGWSLSEDSQLTRVVYKSLQDKISSVKQNLDDDYENAREHYRKALAYLHRHPVDEANSIKEVVASIESVARVLFPKAKTLGDALKLFRQNETMPRFLINSLEQVSTYANATPLVRHGHTNGTRPSLEDAELVLALGTAFVLYLTEKNKASSHDSIRDE